MIVGFDLDGVLCDMDPVQLQICRTWTTDTEKYLADIYNRSRAPLLNPRMFLAEGDTWYIITSRHEAFREATEQWVQKFLPDCDGLFIVGGTPWWEFEDWYEWHKIAAKAKAAKIKELGCDIYIDDSPSFVRSIREELSIPVIQYGGRLDSKWNK